MPPKPKPTEEKGGKLIEHEASSTHVDPEQGSSVTDKEKTMHEGEEQKPDVAATEGNGKLNEQSIHLTLTPAPSTTSKASEIEQQLQHKMTLMVVTAGTNKLIKNVVLDISGDKFDKRKKTMENFNVERKKFVMKEWKSQVNGTPHIPQESNVWYVKISCEIGEELTIVVYADGSQKGSKENDAHRKIKPYTNTSCCIMYVPDKFDSRLFAHSTWDNKGAQRAMLPILVDQLIEQGWTLDQLSDIGKISDQLLKEKVDPKLRYDATLLYKVLLYHTRSEIESFLTLLRISYHLGVVPYGGSPVGKISNVENVMDEIKLLKLYTLLHERISHHRRQDEGCVPWSYQLEGELSSALRTYEERYQHGPTVKFFRFVLSNCEDKKFLPQSFTDEQIKILRRYFPEKASKYIQPLNMKEAIELEVQYDKPDWLDETIINLLRSREYKINQIDISEFRLVLKYCQQHPKVFECALDLFQPNQLIQRLDTLEVQQALLWESLEALKEFTLTNTSDENINLMVSSLWKKQENRAVQYISYVKNCMIKPRQEQLTTKNFIQEIYEVAARLDKDYRQWLENAWKVFAALTGLYTNASANEVKLRLEMFIKGEISSVFVSNLEKDRLEKIFKTLPDTDYKEILSFFLDKDLFKSHHKNVEFSITRAVEFWTKNYKLFSEAAFSEPCIRQGGAMFFPSGGKEQHLQPYALLCNPPLYSHVTSELEKYLNENQLGFSKPLSKILSEIEAAKSHIQKLQIRMEEHELTLEEFDKLKGDGIYSNKAAHCFDKSFRGQGVLIETEKLVNDKQQVLHKYRSCIQQDMRENPIFADHCEQLHKQVRVIEDQMKTLPINEYPSIDLTTVGTDTLNKKTTELHSLKGGSQVFSLFWKNEKRKCEEGKVKTLPLDIGPSAFLKEWVNYIDVVRQKYLHFWEELGEIVGQGGSTTTTTSSDTAQVAPMGMSTLLSILMQVIPLNFDTVEDITTRLENNTSNRYREEALRNEKEVLANAEHILGQELAHVQKFASFSVREKEISSAIRDLLHAWILTDTVKAILDIVKFMRGASSGYTCIEELHQAIQDNDVAKVLKAYRGACSSFGDLRQISKHFAPNFAKLLCEQNLCRLLNAEGWGTIKEIDNFVERRHPEIADQESADLLVEFQVLAHALAHGGSEEMYKKLKTKRIDKTKDLVTILSVACGATPSVLALDGHLQKLEGVLQQDDSVDTIVTARRILRNGGFTINVDPTDSNVILTATDGTKTLTAENLEDIPPQLFLSAKAVGVFNTDNAEDEETQLEVTDLKKELVDADLDKEFPIKTPSQRRALAKRFIVMHETLLEVCDVVRKFVESGHPRPLFPVEIGGPTEVSKLKNSMIAPLKDMTSDWNKLLKTVTVDYPLLSFLTRWQIEEGVRLLMDQEYGRFTELLWICTHQKGVKAAVTKMTSPKQQPRSAEETTIVVNTIQREVEEHLRRWEERREEAKTQKLLNKAAQEGDSSGEEDWMEVPPAHQGGSNNESHPAMSSTSMVEGNQTVAKKTIESESDEEEEEEPEDKYVSILSELVQKYFNRSIIDAVFMTEVHSFSLTKPREKLLEFLGCGTATQPEAGKTHTSNLPICLLRVSHLSSEELLTLTVPIYACMRSRMPHASEVFVCSHQSSELHLIDFLERWELCERYHEEFSGMVENERGEPEEKEEEWKTTATTTISGRTQMLPRENDHGNNRFLFCLANVDLLPASMLQIIITAIRRRKEDSLPRGAKHNLLIITSTKDTTIHQHYRDYQHLISEKQELPLLKLLQDLTMKCMLHHVGEGRVTTYVNANPQSGKSTRIYQEVEKAGLDYVNIPVSKGSSVQTLSKICQKVFEQRKLQTSLSCLQRKLHTTDHRERQMKKDDEKFQFCLHFDIGFDAQLHFVNEVFFHFLVLNQLVDIYGHVTQRNLGDKVAIEIASQGHFTMTVPLLNTLQVKQVALGITPGIRFDFQPLYFKGNRGGPTTTTTSSAPQAFFAASTTLKKGSEAQPIHSASSVPDEDSVIYSIRSSQDDLLVFGATILIEFAQRKNAGGFEMLFGEEIEKKYADSKTYSSAVIIEAVSTILMAGDGSASRPQDGSLLRFFKFASAQMAHFYSQDNLFFYASTFEAQEAVFYRNFAFHMMELIVDCAKNLAYESLPPLTEDAKEDDDLRFQKMKQFHQWSRKPFCMLSDGGDQLVFSLTEGEKVFQQFSDRNPDKWFKNFILQQSHGLTQHDRRSLQGLCSGVTRENSEPTLYTSQDHALPVVLKLICTQPRLSDRLFGFLQSLNKAVEDGNADVTLNVALGKNTSVNDIQQDVHMVRGLLRSSSLSNSSSISEVVRRLLLALEDISHCTVQEVIDAADYWLRAVFGRHNDPKAPPFVLTVDLLIRMVSLKMRVCADVPVVFVGETGCGKTHAVQCFARASGDYYVLITCNEEYTPSFLLQELRPVIALAMNLEKEHPDAKVILQLDEINTLPDMCAAKQIVCDRFLLGVRLPSNIVPVGIMNPVRTRTKEQKEAIAAVDRLGGLNYERYNADARIEYSEHVYQVNRSPESLMTLAWDFGTSAQNFSSRSTAVEVTHQRTPMSVIAEVTNDKISDEILFAENLVYWMERNSLCDFNDCWIGNVEVGLNVDFENQRDNKGTGYHLPAFRAIMCALLHMSQDFLRRVFGNELSVVSLRDIHKTVKLLPHFMKCLVYRQECNGEIPNPDDCPFFHFLSVSMQCAFLMTYYLRLDDGNRRKYLEEFRTRWQKARQPLEKGLSDKFLPVPTEPQNIYLDSFDRLAEYVCHCLTNQEGLARNEALKENTLSLFTAIATDSTLMIVGRPGSSKTRTMESIVAATDPTCSEKQCQFFKKFNLHILKYVLQCSRHTKATDVMAVARKAASMQRQAKEKKCVLVLEEVGVTVGSKHNPLMSLHGLIDYGVKMEAGQYVKIPIVGISNWMLDSSKMNRGLVTHRGNPTARDLESTGKSLLKSGVSSSWLQDFANVFHQRILTSNKETNYTWFHGMRDFYSFIQTLNYFCFTTPKLLHTAATGFPSSSSTFGGGGAIPLNKHMVQWALQISFGGMPSYMHADEELLLTTMLKKFSLQAETVEKPNATWRWSEGNHKLCETCALMKFQLLIATSPTLNSEEACSFSRQRMLQEKKELFDQHFEELQSRFPCDGFNEDHVSNASAASEKQSLEVMAYCLQNKESRHLLIFTENNSALRLLFTLGLASKDGPHAATIIFGSDIHKFESSKAQDLLRVKNCLRRGGTLILVGASHLYEALLDPLNMHYSRSGSGENVVYHTRLPMADGFSQSVRVHPDFRCIILSEESTAKLLLPPLLNRLMKAKLTFHASLQQVQITMVDEILRKSKLRSDKSLVSVLDVLVPGFTSESLASLVHLLPVATAGGNDNGDETLSFFCQRLAMCFSSRNFLWLELMVSSHSGVENDDVLSATTEMTTSSSIHQTSRLGEFDSQKVLPTPAEENFLRRAVDFWTAERDRVFGGDGEQYTSLSFSKILFHSWRASQNAKHCFIMTEQLSLNLEECHKEIVQAIIENYEGAVETVVTKGPHETVPILDLSLPNSDRFVAQIISQLRAQPLQEKEAAIAVFFVDCNHSAGAVSTLHYLTGCESIGEQKHVIVVALVSDPLTKIQQKKQQETMENCSATSQATTGKKPQGNDTSFSLIFDPEWLHVYVDEIIRTYPDLTPIDLAAPQYDNLVDGLTPQAAQILLRHSTVTLAQEFYTQLSLPYPEVKSMLEIFLNSNVAQKALEMLLNDIQTASLSSPFTELKNGYWKTLALQRVRQAVTLRDILFTFTERVCQRLIAPLLHQLLSPVNLIRSFKNRNGQYDEAFSQLFPCVFGGEGALIPVRALPSCTQIHLPLQISSPLVTSARPITNESPSSSSLGTHREKRFIFPFSQWIFNVLHPDPEQSGSLEEIDSRFKTFFAGKPKVDFTKFDFNPMYLNDLWVHVIGMETQNESLVNLATKMICARAHCLLETSSSPSRFEYDPIAAFDECIIIHACYVKQPLALRGVAKFLSKMEESAVSDMHKYFQLNTAHNEMTPLTLLKLVCGYSTTESSLSSPRHLLPLFDLDFLRDLRIAIEGLWRRPDDSIGHDTLSLAMDVLDFVHNVAMAAPLLEGKKNRQSYQCLLKLIHQLLPSMDAQGSPLTTSSSSSSPSSGDRLAHPLQVLKYMLQHRSDYAPVMKFVCPVLLKMVSHLHNSPDDSSKELLHDLCHICKDSKEEEMPDSVRGMILFRTWMAWFDECAEMESPSYSTATTTTTRKKKMLAPFIRTSSCPLGMANGTLESHHCIILARKLFQFFTHPAQMELLRWLDVRFIQSLLRSGQMMESNLEEDEEEIEGGKNGQRHYDLRKAGTFHALTVIALINSALAILCQSIIVEGVPAHLQGSDEVDTDNGNRSSTRAEELRGVFKILHSDHELAQLKAQLDAIFNTGESRSEEEEVQFTFSPAFHEQLIYFTQRQFTAGGVEIDFGRALLQRESVQRRLPKFITQHSRMKTFLVPFDSKDPLAQWIPGYGDAMRLVVAMSQFDSPSPVEYRKILQEFSEKIPLWAQLAALLSASTKKDVPMDKLEGISQSSSGLICPQMQKILKRMNTILQPPTNTCSSTRKTAKKSHSMSRKQVDLFVHMLSAILSCGGDATTSTSGVLNWFEVWTREDSGNQYLPSVTDSVEADDVFSDPHASQIYRCPNGHIWVSDACPTIQSQGVCPKCKAKIGGLNGQLNLGNRRLGNRDEMRQRIQEFQLTTGYDSTMKRWPVRHLTPESHLVTRLILIVTLLGYQIQSGDLLEQLLIDYQHVLILLQQTLFPQAISTDPVLDWFHQLIQSREFNGTTSHGNLNREDVEQVITRVCHARQRGGESSVVPPRDEKDEPIDEFVPILKFTRRYQESVHDEHQKRRARGAEEGEEGGALLFHHFTYKAPFNASLIWEHKQLPLIQLLKKYSGSITEGQKAATLAVFKFVSLLSYICQKLQLTEETADSTPLSALMANHPVLAPHYPPFAKAVTETIGARIQQYGCLHQFQEKFAAPLKNPREANISYFLPTNRNNGLFIQGLCFGKGVGGWVTLPCAQNELISEAKHIMRQPDKYDITVGGTSVSQNSSSGRRSQPNSGNSVLRQQPQSSSTSHNRRTFTPSDASKLQYHQLTEHDLLGTDAIANIEGNALLDYFVDLLDIPKIAADIALLQNKIVADFRLLQLPELPAILPEFNYADSLLSASSSGPSCLQAFLTKLQVAQIVVELPGKSVLQLLSHVQQVPAMAERLVSYLGLLTKVLSLGEISGEDRKRSLMDIPSQFEQQLTTDQKMAQQFVDDHRAVLSGCSIAHLPVLLGCVWPRHLHPCCQVPLPEMEAQQIENAFHYIMSKPDLRQEAYLFLVFLRLTGMAVFSTEQKPAFLAAPVWYCIVGGCNLMEDAEFLEASETKFLREAVKAVHFASLLQIAERVLEPSSQPATSGSKSEEEEDEPTMSRLQIYEIFRRTVAVPSESNPQKIRQQFGKGNVVPTLALGKVRKAHTIPSARRVMADGINWATTFRKK